jgi:hypothetical protein
MEAFIDISKLLIEMISRTLKSSDDAEEEVMPPSSSSTGKLILTHEEWPERTKAQDDRHNGSSSREKDQKNHYGRGSGGGGGGRGESRDPNKPPPSPCFKCHKMGHWSRYYPNKPKKKKEAHLAQGKAEEDQPTLVMAQASVVEVNV